MGYAEELLSDGERIVARQKQHWFVFVAGARFTILAVVIAVILAILSGGIKGDGAPGALRTVLNWITIILFFGGLAVLGWTTLRYLNQEYVLTIAPGHPAPGRPQQDDPGFGPREDQRRGAVAVDLRADVRLRRPRDPDGVGLGDQQVPHDHRPDRLQEGDPQRQARVRHGHGRRVPTGPADPRRGAAAAAGDAYCRCDRRDGRAGRGTGDRAASAPRTTDPDEVARTLTALADLRDRGAISAEEYEAKKADLLGRL